MTIDAVTLGLLRGNFQSCFIFLEDWLTRLITAVWMVQILKYIVLFFVFLNSVQNARYSSNLTKGAQSNNNNTMPRFSVGAYMEKKKQANEEKISKREDIERLEIEIKEQEDTLAKKRKLSRSLDEKLRRLDVKVR